VSFHLLLRELIGHAVPVVVELDVAVPGSAVSSLVNRGVVPKETNGEPSRSAVTSYSMSTPTSNGS
jgi:hypothetical protein